MYSDVRLLRSAVARLRILSSAQRIGVAFAAIFYVVAGALHFIKAEPYLRIMPPYIPWHVAMVRVSGACEILGGLGLLVSGTRRAASWGLVALLIVVVSGQHLYGDPSNRGQARLPSRLCCDGAAFLCNCSLVWWLLWCTKARYVLR